MSPFLFLDPCLSPLRTWRRWGVLKSQLETLNTSGKLLEYGRFFK